ncbi:uncharacterized protein LOC110621373 isoform X1 [Manihot esculenta]|uniref:uncharacterized protein LOC110621373 isoform X1 n=1 Tax=Manihot esculenta TaxID=3983 RepID=UPI001CC7FF9B|nr:uncharacterized protein LOC110621373 isoform X1 [Manihot esculenta]
MVISIITVCFPLDLCFLLSHVSLVVLVLFVMFVHRLLNWIPKHSNMSFLATLDFKKTLPAPSIHMPGRPPIFYVYSRRLEDSDSAPLPTSSSTDPASIDPSPSDLDFPIDLRKGKRTCTHQFSSFVSYSQLSSFSRSFSTALNSISVPKTVMKTLSHPGSRAAMKEEMIALDINGTWELMSLPL